jgi:hypothetical protein
MGDEHAGPCFLFRVDPKLDSYRWDAHGYALGNAFLGMSIPSVINLWVLRKDSRGGKTTIKLLMHSAVLVNTLTRAFGLLVDPHYTREVLPAVIVGVSHGLPNPALNTAIGLVLFSLHEELATSKGGHATKLHFCQEPIRYLGV